MELVPLPAVMVPPLIVQPYEAPAPASATEAVLSVELGQTELATVMVEAGIAMAVMVALPENVPGEQPVLSETAATV
jgi:hypothetical protein